MVNFLTSIDWEVGIGVLVGAAVALAIAYFQHRPKRLDYKVVTNRPFLSDSRFLSHSEFAVTWMDLPVTSPRIIAVRLANTGKQPIKREDFDGQPLRVSLSGENPLVMVEEVTRCVPKDMSIGVEVFGSEDGSIRTLEVAPALMNPGDWFEVQIVADEASGGVEVEGRIAGVKRIRDVEAVSGRRSRMAYWGTGSVLVLGTVLTAIFGESDPADLVLFMALILVLPLSVLVYALIDSRRRPRPF